MKFISRLLTTAAGLLISTVPANAQTKEEKDEPSPKQLVQINALTPDGVANGVVIEDDDLETIANLTTVEAFRGKRGFNDVVEADNCFRAFVDKRTGRVTYQLYQTIAYAIQRRDFRSVNFATDEGPKTAELLQIGNEITACNNGVCGYEDTIAFPVSIELMREIAGKYVAGTTYFWRFKFKSRTSFDWEDRISAAEAAGLLIAVERYQAAKGKSR